MEDNIKGTFAFVFAVVDGEKWGCAVRLKPKQEKQWFHHRIHNQWATTLDIWKWTLEMNWQFHQNDKHRYTKDHQRFRYINHLQETQVNKYLRRQPFVFFISRRLKYWYILANFDFKQFIIIIAYLFLDVLVC